MLDAGYWIQDFFFVFNSKFTAAGYGILYPVLGK